MWKYHKFSKVIRVIVSIVVIFIFGCLLFGDDDSDVDYSRPLEIMIQTLHIMILQEIQMIIKTTFW